jgi:hypothetical protein
MAAWLDLGDAHALAAQAIGLRLQASQERGSQRLSLLITLMAGLPDGLVRACRGTLDDSSLAVMSLRSH